MHRAVKAAIDLFDVDINDTDDYYVLFTVFCAGFKITEMRDDFGWSCELLGFLLETQTKNKM